MLQRKLGALMVITILLSGLSGFAGTYLANGLNDRTLVPLQQQAGSQVDQETHISLAPLSGSTSGILPLTVPEIAARTADSVVEIMTETVSGGGRIGQFISQGAGSGVIVDPSGYIITNHHVIEGATRITVRLRNGETYSATLVGRDVRTDIAIIKIEAQGLSYARLGDSDALVVGELAVAIGNPLGQLGGTVTEGIISALDRNIEIDGQKMRLLQTSAAINPGNSGGALFNRFGELIGIVNAKSSGSGIEGLGFAIPINAAVDVARQIIEYGFVPGRADLGVVLLDINSLSSAMLYRVHRTGIYVHSTTESNGLQPGDRIISINDVSVHSSRDVALIIADLRAGEIVRIIVERNRQALAVDVTLVQAR